MISGPSLAAPMQLRVVDDGIQFTNESALFWDDEETLWRCMNRYNQIEEQADLDLHRILFPLNLC